MGQFLVQVKGTAMVITLPYASSLERGATIAGTEAWLMDLPQASFNQFAKGSMQAVRLRENAVAWIPYGWVTMMVNSTKEICQTLAIPYLNAKLALRYPCIALLVNFHLGHVKQGNREKGNRYWGQTMRTPSSSGLPASTATIPPRLSMRTPRPPLRAHPP